MCQLPLLVPALTARPRRRGDRKRARHDLERASANTLQAEGLGIHGLRRWRRLLLVRRASEQGYEYASVLESWCTLFSCGKVVMGE